LEELLNRMFTIPKYQITTLKRRAYVPHFIGGGWRYRDMKRLSPGHLEPRLET
jgi:hypothetical protein